MGDVIAQIRILDRVRDGLIPRSASSRAGVGLRQQVAVRQSGVYPPGVFARRPRDPVVRWRGRYLPAPPRSAMELTPDELV